MHNKDTLAKIFQAHSRKTQGTGINTALKIFFEAMDTVKHTLAAQQIDFHIDLAPSESRSNVYRDLGGNAFGSPLYEGIASVGDSFKIPVLIFENTSKEFGVRVNRTVAKNFTQEDTIGAIQEALVAEAALQGSLQQSRPLSQSHTNLRRFHRRNG